MSEEKKRSERLARVIFKRGDKDYPLVGFIEQGRYGPELRFVHNADGEWYDREPSLKLHNKDGDDFDLPLPKWPVRIKLEEGVTFEKAGDGDDW